MTALTLLPTVEAPSLVLRELVLADAGHFARYMTRPSYQRYLALRYPNERAVRQFVARAVARQDRRGRKTYHLAGEIAGTGRVIADGFILFHETRACEIGWGVDPSHWGKGLGREVARVLISLAIERLGSAHVWCKVMSGNRASLRVAEAAGLTHDRVVAAFDRRHGRNGEVHVFTLGRDDYYDLPY